jgi:hypothetical protein
MQHFESAGLWSLEGDFSHSVGGTLILDDDGLRLELLGGFSSDWTAGVERYPNIHGVVGGNPYGVYVTLIDSIRQHTKYNMAGLMSETIRCGRAIIGATHLQDRAFNFELLEIMLSHLKDWVGVTGITFDVSGNLDYTITYTKPVLPSFAFGDKKLTLAPNVGASRGMHRASLDEEILILLEPVGERLPAELGGEEIQTLQNLLTFATDSTNAIEGITYYGPEDDRGIHPDYHVLFDPVFRLKERKEVLHLTDMLFSLTDTQALGLNIFDKWLDFTVRNRGFCTVYFANLYAEPRFLSDRFAKSMHAFSLLATTTRQISEQTKLFISDIEAASKSRFRDEDRDYVRHVIPTGDEIEMPFHLLRVLHENSEIIGMFIDNADSFVHSVCSSLDYFQRRLGGAQDHMQGKELLYVTLKIRLVTKIMVLKELGFTADAIKHLIVRNNKIGFLRNL